MFYVLDENNNKIEAFDKEGVLNAIETAIANGSLASLVADAAFVTKLKCCVTGQTNKVAYVTEAKLNELETQGLLETGVEYHITDDSSLALIETAVKDVNDILNGNVAVPSATQAAKAKKVNADALTITDGESEYIKETGLYAVVAHLGGVVDVDGTGIIAIRSLNKVAIGSEVAYTNDGTLKERVYYNGTATTKGKIKLTGDMSETEIIAAYKIADL